MVIGTVAEKKAEERDKKNKGKNRVTVLSVIKAENTEKVTGTEGG